MTTDRHGIPSDFFIERGYIAIVPEDIVYRLRFLGYYYNNQEEELSKRKRIEAMQGWMSGLKLRTMYDYIKDEFVRSEHSVGRRKETIRKDDPRWTDRFELEFFERGHRGKVFSMSWHEQTTPEEATDLGTHPEIDESRNHYFTRQDYGKGSNAVEMLDIKESDQAKIEAVALNICKDYLMGEYTFREACLLHKVTLETFMRWAFVYKNVSVMYHEADQLGTHFRRSQIKQLAENHIIKLLQEGGYWEEVEYEKHTRTISTPEGKYLPSHKVRKKKQLRPADLQRLAFGTIPEDLINQIGGKGATDSGHSEMDPEKWLEENDSEWLAAKKMESDEDDD